MTWHEIATPSVTEMYAARLGDVDIVLVQARSEWYAIEDYCSHAGCAFSDDGEVDGLVIVCNCHGSEFDIASGEVVAPPAIEPIRTFPVRFSGGTVEVQV